MRAGKGEKKMDYEVMAKQFMDFDDKKKKKVFFAFIEKYSCNGDGTSVLDCETLKRIMPVISTPNKKDNRFVKIFGMRYYTEYIYKNFAETYCIEIDDYCEDDYTIKVWISLREDEIEYEDFEWTSVLFIKEFWNFYSNYVND